MPGLTAGAPLRAMAGLSAIWILARVLSWSAPVHAPWPSPDMMVGKALHEKFETQRPQAHVSSLNHNGERPRNGRHLSSRPLYHRALHGPQRPEENASQKVSALWQDRAAAGHFFLQASFRDDRPTAAARPPRLPPFSYPQPSRPDHKLSAYLWIYLRQDRSPGGAASGSGARSIANGQYGGSQAGALLSYRLQSGPAPEISLYGRVSAALDPWSQKEIALGGRVQPLPGLPVALHAEQRFDMESGKAAGTALYATGGTGPDPIVGRLALETYAQAGYVLGQNSSYFFDGFATLHQPVVEFDRKTLAAGVGLWTGGQRGITRLDLGPSAHLALPLRSGAARISVDGRIRIAGNARPASGAAVTISTSF